MTPLTPVIAGPTAGGKSDLAIALAEFARERHGVEAEVITADAFQVYRGMDIGTAKPSVAERRGVPHHLIDLVPAHDDGGGGLAARSFTVEDWLALATAKIADARNAGRLPIVVGGTHLYIKALLDGLFQGPEPDPALRAELNAMDPDARREELERVDPAAAARIHPNDSRRTVRALEVFRQTGRPISAHQRQWDRTHPTSEIRRPTLRLVILDWPTEALNQRINARVKQMMDRGGEGEGLLAEVRALVERGPLRPQAAEALGYKQLLPLLAPEAGGAARAWPPPDAEVAAAVEKIKVETRRFGKNQRTWLRRLRTTPGALTIACPPVPGPEAAARIWANICPV